MLEDSSLADDWDTKSLEKRLGIQGLGSPLMFCFPLLPSLFNTDSICTAILLGKVFFAPILSQLQINHIKGSPGCLCPSPQLKTVVLTDVDLKLSSSSQTPHPQYIPSHPSRPKFVLPQIKMHPPLRPKHTHTSFSYPTPTLTSFLHMNEFIRKLQHFRIPDLTRFGQKVQQR